MHPRSIRSFVLRAGRTTAAQERALEQLWPAYGITLNDALLDLGVIFGRAAPRCLEIGFGVGEVIGSLAEANPGTDYVGVEVHPPGVGRLLLRADSARLKNLRVICADAVEVLRDHVPDESFDEILVFFPDPWHKKRHHKRRLIEERFVAALAAKLRAGGILRLATDWQAYAEQMRDVCNANPQLQSLSPDLTFVARPDFRPSTRFERRGARLGHGVWDLAYVKRETALGEKAAADAIDDELHRERREDHAG
ncbi:MAG TPA: tRNA (guanosine(46)-N7)-methyltransferase TrmB [Steroidobacteraceae bacterium]|jgi:tRNA (guanine-N7-)-methyltransferase